MCRQRKKIIQETTKEFYEKQGYQVFGEEDFDEGCPHIWMYKDIK